MRYEKITKNSKSPRPIMRAATFINVAYGALETMVGGVTNSSAAAANGVHNFADGLSHAAHTATHIEEHKEDYQAHKVQKRRKIAAGAIAAGALITGYNSIDAIQNAEPEALNKLALAVELGAVSINGVLVLKIKNRADGTLAQKDAYRHHITDGMIATTTATSIAISPIVPTADGLGGLFATGASMVLAYKTLENKLEHEN